LFLDKDYISSTVHRPIVWLCFVHTLECVSKPYVPSQTSDSFSNALIAHYEDCGTKMRVLLYQLHHLILADSVHNQILT
jgi:hypothetical protein